MEMDPTVCNKYKNMTPPQKKTAMYSEDVFI